MATFTINDDNNITAFASVAEPGQAGDSTATSFDSQAALAQVSADWPLSRFVEIWNSIPGNTSVSKFADRKKAVARIWKAIQPLAAIGQPSEAPAEATAPSAANPEPKRGRKQSKPAKVAKKVGKPAKTVAAKKTAAKPKASGAEEAQRANKKAEVIAMMQRAKGATLDEIMEATGWQRHTVRGFVSILGSKGGHTVESSKNTAGERTYKIAK
jgi:hypothetical protein